jgi:hypothetical protein
MACLNQKGGVTFHRNMIHLWGCKLAAEAKELAISYQTELMRRKKSHLSPNQTCAEKKSILSKNLF